jgi:septation ring formation regulator EzrA
MERISLVQLGQGAFLSYMSSQEIPPPVQAALRQAVNLWNVVNAAEAAVTEAENRRSFLANEQDRVRKNIEVTGNQTQQGQEYLKRLQSIDSDIDKIAGELEKLRADVKKAQKAYTDYLSGLNL